MKKGIIIAVFIFFLVGSFVSASEKISQEIYKKDLSEKIYVNVILKENILDNTSKNFLSKQSIKTKINSKNVVREFKSTRGFSANLTYEEILDLSKNSEIKFIGEVRKFKVSLSESVEIIGANSIWETQIENVNLTGTGQTICIIDTGINFSHSDLSVNYLGGYDFFNNDNDSSDDNGHGTHVAGIVAANGAIKGIAPGAKIIAIKALGPDGSGTDFNIAAGIDWCVDNSSKYNISVISMSLGNDCVEFPQYCYNNYCDSDPDETILVNAINRAVANNISVVVASGNDANYTHISSPACASNATQVGSSTKSDLFSSFSNRNSLVSLFAPGGNGFLEGAINSTCILGDEYELNGYCRKQGTSMATPMVAGAIALIKQKLELTSQTKTPSEIEQILNETGKVLDDSAHSGLNFSRINISAAIEYLNLPILSVGGNLPENNSYRNYNTTTFNCSASSEGNYQLTNITLSLWNSSDLIYNNTAELSGSENSSSWNYELSTENSYIWNCVVFNNNSQNATSSNYTLNYDITYPEISGVSVSVTSSSATLIWNTSEETNVSIVSGNNLTNNSFSVNHSETISGLSASTTYSYNLTYCDRAGNCNSTDGNFTTSAATVIRSSGGGGGGGGGKVLPISSAQISTGYNKNFFVSEKLNFVLNNENHSLQLNKIINQTINLTIRSEPINILLSVGEIKKINLSSSEYYDLKIKLENISQNKANVTIQSIYEPIVIENRFRIQNETQKIIEEEKIKSEKKSYFGEIIIILLGILIVLIAFIERKINWKRLKSKTTLKEYEKIKA